MFKIIHPFRKLKRTIYLEGFELILKVEKRAYKFQLNEKINTFSRDCQYYFLIFRTLKFRDNDRCTRSHFFLNCRVFLCTNEIANRSDGSETGGAQFTPSTPGLQELFRLFLCLCLLSKHHKLRSHKPPQSKQSVNRKTK